jgi:hypothetical protein
MLNGNELTNTQINFFNAIIQYNPLATLDYAVETAWATCNDDLIDLCGDKSPFGEFAVRDEDTVQDFRRLLNQLRKEKGNCALKILLEKDFLEWE